MRVFLGTSNSKEELKFHQEIEINFSLKNAIKINAFLKIFVFQRCQRQRNFLISLNVTCNVFIVVFEVIQ
jgi:hypothetical protein